MVCLGFRFSLEMCLVQRKRCPNFHLADKDWTILIAGAVQRRASCCTDVFGSRVDDDEFLFRFISELTGTEFLGKTVQVAGRRSARHAVRSGYRSVRKQGEYGS